jgi:uridine kinase
MENLTNRPLVIGIAGGSGCGKTHLANEIAKVVGEENVLVLSMDQYFCSTDDPKADATSINFDHPKHLDFQLLLKHIRQLQEGKPVFAPGYDFRNMTRIWATEPTRPKPVIVVEGLFVLAQPVVQMCDLACYLDVAADERLLGRILRDTYERGVTTEQVIDRYQRYVRPSYEIFVRPTKQNADIVVDFTYRRSLFTQFISHTISDFLTGKLCTEAFVSSLRGDSFVSGVDRSSSYMPLTTDIMLLSKAYPESITPLDASRSHLSSPALSAFGGGSSEQEQCLAI